MKKPSGKLAFAYATIANLEEKIARIEAAQPAPVAVVLPERKSVNTHNSHDWDEGYTDGWVAYDTALKRLNPSL